MNASKFSCYSINRFTINIKKYLFSINNNNNNFLLSPKHQYGIILIFFNQSIFCFIYFLFYFNFVLCAFAFIFFIVFLFLSFLFCFNFILCAFAFIYFVLFYSVMVINNVVIIYLIFLK